MYVCMHTNVCVYEQCVIRDIRLSRIYVCMYVVSMRLWR